MDDSARYFQWANDPLTRANAFSTAPIPVESHEQWYRDRMAAPDRYVLFVVETLAGLAVGQARFERAESFWSVDYSLDASWRGRGLGRPMLRAALAALADSCRGSDSVVLGRVKESNVASCRVFESLCFHASPEAGGVVSYRRSL